MNPSIVNCERLNGISTPRVLRNGNQPDANDHLPCVVPSLPAAGRTVLADPKPFAPMAEPPRHVRRLLFRCVRVALTGAVLAGAGVCARHALISATSEVAYINAEMSVLRAPIEGELSMERDQLGVLIPQGATLFKIQNSRLGNQEVIAQLNWLRELAERLQAEVAEAAVREKEAEEIYQAHQKLFEAKLISRLAFVEEQTKLTLARTVLASKQTQVRQAEARIVDMERQAALRKEAAVEMPFDGVAWTISAKSGLPIAAYEPVTQVIDQKRIWVEAFFHEKHAPKLHKGARVTIRALDGTAVWRGEVESMRSGVGRIASGQVLAAPTGGFTPRRVAVRVTMDATNPYDASEFFGVGRSVVVSLDGHE